MFDIKNLLNNRKLSLSINGRIPEELEGSLYRIGPALVERNGRTKNTLIEGDGFVRSLKLNPLINGAEFRESFVQTEKFKQESRQNKFIYRTVATRAPGFLKNLGFNLTNLANVNVLVWNQKLLALDEMQPLFELDAQTLESRGEFRQDVRVMAHAKLCPDSKDYILPSIKFFPQTRVQFLKLKGSGEQELSATVDLPTCGYVHDWWLTKNYYIFVLPPLFLNLKKIIPLGLGLCTHAEALYFDQTKKNRVVVIERNSLKKLFEGEAAANWFWHSVGARESGDKIILDLVSTPYKILNSGSKLLKSDLLRYTLNLAKNSLEQEKPLENLTIEFPTTVDGEDSCWFLTNSESSSTLNRLTRFDFSTKTRVNLDFNLDQTLMSPVVIKSASGRVYVLLEVHNANSKNSSFYIIENEKQSLAIKTEIALSDELPFSFHGCWN
ncbi:MAG: carotenoid oxygenase family protein [Pseudobdellovibrio sp.]